MLADHLGQGDYNLSFLYVMLVLITAGAFGWIGWIHRGAVRAAGAVTAIGLIAIAVAIVSWWEGVTNVMDRLAGPQGGDFRAEYVDDLLRETGVVLITAVLIASLLAWVFAGAIRARGHSD